MKHGSTSRRSRNNRGGGRRNNNAKSKVYDSNGPDVRIRGTAHQITEKYLNLAKDSSSSGDHVMAESYMQHAEHYQRIINGWHEQIEELLRSGKYASETHGQEGQKELQYPKNSYQIGRGADKRKARDENGDVNGNLKESSGSELADA
mgnify:CR=1 FL=1